MHFKWEISPIDDNNGGTRKLGHFFPISEREQGRPPPSPPLVTRMRMYIAERNNKQRVESPDEKEKNRHKF